MMPIRLAATVVGALAAMVPSAAMADCRVAPPLVATTPAMQPFVDRYHSLTARDPYLMTGKAARDWRLLVDDLKADKGADTALVARSEMMLAGSLKGDASVAAALVAAQDALALAEAGHVADPSLHAALVAMVAAQELRSGKAAQAVTHADAALAEAAQADGTESWAYGSAAQTAAEAHFAVADYRRSEPLSATAGRLAAACLPDNTSIIGGLMSGHAAELQASGRPDEALAEHERAVSWDMSHLPESDEVVPYALGQLAWSLVSAERLHEAEGLLRRAVDLYARHHPDLVAERVSTAAKFANVLALQYKYSAAEAIWKTQRDLLASRHDLTNPWIESASLRGQADAAQGLDKWDEALALRARAVALIERIGQPKHPELAMARIEYATALVALGRAREGAAIAEPAVAMLRAVDPPASLRRLNAELAHALIADEAGADPTKTYAALAPAVARLETVLLDNATSPRDLARFAGRFAFTFAGVARLALAAHDEEAAFHAIQLANLSDVMLVRAGARARAAAADPQVRALIERVDTLRRDRRGLDRDRTAATAAGDAARLATLDAAARHNDADTAQAAQALDRAFPTYRALGRTPWVTLAAFRARLGPDDVLLAPVMLDRQVLVVTVTREGLRWAAVPVSRARVMGTVQRLRASIDAARADPHAAFDLDMAAKLRAVLMPPALAPVFADHRHILYFASRFLADVPIAALPAAATPSGGETAWLIRTHRISAATTLAPAAESAPARDGFLGIGAPVTGHQPLTAAMRGGAARFGDFAATPIAAPPPLPHAERELREMARLFPAGERRLLTGAAATKAAVEAAPLDRFGVIAFATHGLVPDALPGLTQPGLLLTPGTGTASDGVLTASDVAALHLDADWVILSACDTAGGSDAQSGSYSGLASAFIQAGARALLVSYWPVRDDAAQRIAVATLAASRRGVDRPAALQQAMLALISATTVPGGANPAIWAPFVLVDR